MSKPSAVEDGRFPYYIVGGCRMSGPFGPSEDYTQIREIGSDRIVVEGDPKELAIQLEVLRMHWKGPGGLGGCMTEKEAKLVSICAQLEPVLKELSRDPDVSSEFIQGILSLQIGCSEISIVAQVKRIKAMGAPTA